MPVVPTGKRNVRAAGPSKGSIRAPGVATQRHITPTFITSQLSGTDARFSGVNAKYAGTDARRTGVNARYTGTGARYAGVNAKYAGTDARRTGVNARHTGIGARYAGVDARYVGTDARYSGVSASYSGLNARHRSNTPNLVGPPRPAYRSTASATPEAFGGDGGLTGLGQGLSTFGIGMQQIARRKQEMELKQLDADFSTSIRDLMYGNPDAEVEGYLSTQNENAISGYVPLRQKIAEVRQELHDGASSDSVRERFTLAASRRVNVAYTSAAMHVNNAQKSQYELVTKARINNAVNDAANNPALLNHSLATIGQEVGSLMMRNGVSDSEVISGAILEEQSRAVSTSISVSLTQNNPQGAASILRDYGQMMTGVDKARVSVGVMRSLVVGEAQDIADEIRELDLQGEARFAYARERAAGDTRDKLMSLLDADDRRRRQGEQEQRTAEQEALPTEAQTLFDEIRSLDLTPTQEIAKAREFSSGDIEDSVVARLRQEHTDTRSKVADRVDATVQLLLDEYPDLKAQSSLLNEWRENDPAKFTPSVVAKVRRNLIVHDNQEQAEREVAVKDALSGAALAINQDGQSLDEFMAQNPDTATLIRSDYNSYTKAQALDRNRRNGDRFSQVSDGKTLHRIRQMDAKDRLSVDLETEPNLTEQEFNEASRMQAMDQHMKEETHDAMYASVRRLLGRMVDRRHDYTNPSGQSAADRRYNQDITMHANMAAYQYVQENGKAPDEISLTRLVSDAIQGVVVDNEGGLFGAGGILGSGLFDEKDVDFSTLKTLNTDQINGSFKDYEEIPLDVRTRIIAVAAEQGIKYTDTVPPEDAIEVAAAMWLIYDSGNPNSAVAMARFKQVLGID